MANQQFNKTNITNGNIVEPSDITQLYNALDGTTPYEVTITGSLNVSPNQQISGSAADTKLSGSFSGSFRGDGSNLTGVEWDGSHNGNASITGSLSQGANNTASGSFSHAEGRNTKAIGNYSHAEGADTIAIGYGSHAEGAGTIASGSSQSVVGRYNTHNDTGSLFIVGSGLADNSRNDAFKITQSSSLALPTTQSAAPTWTGINGEIIPATVGGVHYLYMWMSGAWRSASFA